MNRIHFEKEYEFFASPEVLFHFVSNPKGLKEWFADNVSAEGNNFIFTWDGVPYEAKKVNAIPNEEITFEFVSHKKDAGNNGSIHFKLTTSELTQTTFLHISDSSDILDDPNDISTIWDNMCHQLKEVAGS
jgi:uncharacterized protein YndB with AHSA1/START domain